MDSEELNILCAFGVCVIIFGMGYFAGWQSAVRYLFEKNK